MITSTTSFPAAPLVGPHRQKATRRTAACFAVGVALAALAGCGGDSDGGSTSTDDLVAVMVDAGAPEDTATCVAEKLDGVTTSDLEDFMSEVASGADVEATSGTAKEFINANTECNLAE